jgi:sec-independent protein translocase protein TatB
MSFGELLILGVIAIVVVGPRKLPTLLRGAGQLIGHLRRLAVDVRKESGIDQLLEAEGINKEIDSFRRLAAGDVTPDDPHGGRPKTETATADTGQTTDPYRAAGVDPEPLAPAGETSGPPATANESPPDQPSPIADAKPR